MRPCGRLHLAFTIGKPPQMAPKPEYSPLRVRRYIHVSRGPNELWGAFLTKESMEQWWGAKPGTPEAGTAQGQFLDVYEPRAGGCIQMAVMWEAKRVSYGGTIQVFEAGKELTFESNWIPNRGWAAPTFVTIRLSPALAGTLVELFHHGFEHTGANAAAEHAGYETGWGMTQLNALKQI